MLQKIQKARLLQRAVLPFVASFALLALLALALDGLLHALDLRWVGRWLGIPGTLLIIASTVYSLRKRKLIRRGQPAQLRNILVAHVPIAGLLGMKLGM
jgi:hypothetical protein